VPRRFCRVGRRAPGNRCSARDSGPPRRKTSGICRVGPDA